MKIITQSFLVLILIIFSGCAHQISFHEIDYQIGTNEHNAGLTVFIDSNTLNKQVTIKSFMTGFAHSWNVEPGKMVKQVADIEFPQMFKHYRFSKVFPNPSKGTPHITLELTVPKYEFANFRATFTLRVKAYGKGKKLLLDESYIEQGISQGAKMFWGGAFAMKSAIRQSSFGALKNIFESLRRDLAQVLLLNKKG